MPAIIEEFEAMIEKDPQNAMARYILANEYLKAGMDENAIEQLRAYLQLTEDEGAAYRMLGQVLDRLGRIDEARQAYEQGIAQALKHGHPGMAEEFRETLQELSASN
jgi:predicted Zn-dependent protease